MWILPGYLVLVFWEKNKADTASEGWRLIFPSAFVSCMIFPIANLLKYLIYKFLGHVFQSSTISNTKEFWRIVVPDPQLDSLASSLIFAFLLGLSVQKVCRLYRDPKSSPHLWPSIKKLLKWLGIDDFDSNLQMRLVRLVECEVIVGLKNGRFYQGILKEIDVKTDESITLEPTWSGRRAEKGVVEYDTYYPRKSDLEEAGLVWRSEDVELTLMVSDISSIARFNAAFNQLFVDCGKTIYKSFDSESAQEKN